MSYKVRLESLNIVKFKRYNNTFVMSIVSAGQAINTLIVKQFEAICHLFSLPWVYHYDHLPCV